MSLYSVWLNPEIVYTMAYMACDWVQVIPNPWIKTENFKTNTKILFNDD